MELTKITGRSWLDMIPMMPDHRRLMSSKISDAGTAREFLQYLSSAPARDPHSAPTHDPQNRPKPLFGSAQLNCRG